MPKKWKNIIKKSRKYNWGTNGVKYLYFIPSRREIFGTGGNSTYEKQYQYYKNGNTKERYNGNGVFSVDEKKYWIRDCVKSGEIYYCVDESGNAVQENARMSLGLAPCFALY